MHIMMPTLVGIMIVCIGRNAPVVVNVLFVLCVFCWYYSPVATYCWSYRASCCVARVTSRVTWVTLDTASLMNRYMLCSVLDLSTGKLCLQSLQCAEACAVSSVSKCCNGEGGISPISSPQTALQEFDYTVTNLATDLRDGLRLALVCQAGFLCLLILNFNK